MAVKFFTSKPVVHESVLPLGRLNKGVDEPAVGTSSQEAHQEYRRLTRSDFSLPSFFLRRRWKKEETGRETLAAGGVFLLGIHPVGRLVLLALVAVAAACHAFDPILEPKDGGASPEGGPGRDASLDAIGDADNGAAVDAGIDAMFSDGSTCEMTTELPHDGIDNDCDGILDTDSWLQVEGNDEHACALRMDNTVECWGRNSSGEASPPPILFRQITTGGVHSCGIRLDDDTVACWGGDNEGQASPPFGMAFQQISAGAFFTCGIKADDSLDCWGDDRFGLMNFPLGSFLQVSAGHSHACAIRANGMVTCWGNIDSAESGPPAETFEQISAGICGIKTDQRLACWGLPLSSPIVHPPRGTFLEVGGARQFHACAIGEDRQIECWGSNAFDLEDNPLEAPAGTFLHLGVGYTHNCAIRTDDTLACWGDNRSGQADFPSP